MELERFRYNIIFKINKKIYEVRHLIPFIYFISYLQKEF